MNEFEQLNTTLPPRPIRRRADRQWSIFPLWKLLFVIPLLLPFAAGIAVFIGAGKMLTVFMAGKMVPAQVISLNQTKPVDGKGAKSWITYSYRYHEKTYYHEEYFPPDVYPAFLKAKTITVVVSPIWPKDSYPVQPYDLSPGPAFTLVVTLFAGFLNFMLWKDFAFYGFTQSFHFWLFKKGAVAPGVVIGKNATSAKGVRHYLEYSFSPTGQPDRTVKRVIGKQLWREVHPGDSITVFYHPKWSGLNVVYGDSDYEIEF